MLGSKKSPVDRMIVELITSPEDFENGTEGWYICHADGMPHAGPYNRKKDAKGQLTRLRKGYTPAARIVNG